jgi:hypothetical protein
VEDEDAVEEDDVDWDEEEEDEALPVKRFVAPRNPVVFAVVALPEPVLWTVGAEVSDAPEVDVLLLDEEALEFDDPPGLPPPAVLTTVTWRMVVLPPVIVMLIPPRLPRSCGTINELYFSAAVTPVMRSVSSTVPFVTFTVRTATVGAFGDEELVSPDSRSAENRPIAPSTIVAAASHQTVDARNRDEPLAGFGSDRMGN